MNEYEEFNKELDKSIAEYGWHVIKVMADEEGPGFCFSVGLFKSFGHPEIIIVGLDLDLGHELINLMGDEIREGVKFEAGQYYDDIIEEYSCYMLEVSKENYEGWLGTAIGYYQSEDFPVLQCIYPTVDNVYPWQEEWPEEIEDLQPVLAEIPEE